MKKTALALLTVASIAACSSHEDESGTPNLTVTISGEGSALTGFAFPPASSNDVTFVDGWDVKFDRILVTIDDIVLSDNPDMSPTDQARTGAVVAKAKGPWAVDMTKPGAVTDIKPRAQARSLSDHGGNALAYGGGNGKDPNAQSLARFDALDGDRSFDPARRYAFGFDMVTASTNAKHTNLDAAAETDYAEMVSKGLSVLYVGTATFKGTDCKSSDPSYDWSRLPKLVKFRFGFKSPTTYKNCQNTDLHGKPFAGEEAQRGVQVGSQGGTIAQITLHVDHPFWNTVDHDAAELFFDQMAAAASADGELVTDDLARLDFTSFKDAAGKDLPWRSCVADKPVKPGGRRFDSGSVPVDPKASAESAFRSYADYVTYQQSTQGHLNADGLCAVERRFAAPR
jgi:hypothetical protein